jgi:hypothetical protein
LERSGGGEGKVREESSKLSVRGKGKEPKLRERGRKRGEERSSEFQRKKRQGYSRGTSIR